MASGVFLFRDPAQTRGLSSADPPEFLQFGLSPGRYLVLAQGYAFADINTKLRLRLEVADGSDEAEIDFGVLPPGKPVVPFSLTFGATLEPVPDPLITNRVHFGALFEAGTEATVGGIRIVALTVDNVSILIPGA